MNLKGNIQTSITFLPTSNLISEIPPSLMYLKPDLNEEANMLITNTIYKPHLLNTILLHSGFPLLNKTITNSSQLCSKDTPLFTFLSSTLIV